MSRATTPLPSERFSPLGAVYAKFRPTYPGDILDWLAALIDLSPGREVADIGAGTGLFTQLLLERGLRVQAVEPSARMLAEAVARLSGYKAFFAVAGTAEKTTLPPASVGVIFCAQAFHWFNHEATVVEWRRILRPGGWAALVWNNVDLTDPFGRELVNLMKHHSTDAGRTLALALEVQQKNVLFGKAGATKATFPNRQVFDYAGLVGRTDSVSYVPKPGRPGYEQMMEGLRALFDEHQSAGQVTLRYESVVLVGPVGAPEL